jgi:hypothetical protein
MTLYLHKIINRILCNKFSFRGNIFKLKTKNKEIIHKKELAQLLEKINNKICKISMIILHNKIFYKIDRVDKLKIIK